MSLTNVWVQTQGDGLVRADQIVGIKAHQTPALAGKPARWLFDVVLTSSIGSGTREGWDVTALHRTLIQTGEDPGAEFSLVMIKSRAIQRAIAAIPDTAWTPVRYPGTVHDSDTGEWISDAEVAEVPYTAFAATKDRITALLVVRRRQGRPLPRRSVPGVALPPVLHQLDAADRTGRHRPPPSRDHRNRVRRPDRRALGAPAVRALRRQLRLGTVRRDRAQPAPRRRHPRWPRPRRRPGRDPAPTTDHRARPTGPPRPHARPAPTQPLALGAHMAPAVGPDHRPQPTRRRLTPIPPATRPEHPDQWKSWTDQRLRHASRHQPA